MLSKFIKNILNKFWKGNYFCYYFVITKFNSWNYQSSNIGNSKGIKNFLKTILEKYNIQDKIEFILEKGFIVLKPKAEPRKDWEKAFQEMHKTVMTNCLLMMFLMTKILKNGTKSIRNCFGKS